jgi:hypothetical protein
MKRDYKKPTVITEMSFETSALACGKTVDPPPGSWHFSSAYDTFTGHFGPQMADESSSGSCGVGFGPGGTSQSYGYSGLCGNWSTFTS